MLAIELVERRRDEGSPQPISPSGRRISPVSEGLVLLSCGLYGNVVRILVPILAPDEDVDEGLAILEEALVDASDGAS